MFLKGKDLGILNFIIITGYNNHDLGLLDCWCQDDNRPFFSDENSEEPMEKWQRELYHFIFHDTDGQPSFFKQAWQKIKNDFPNKNKVLEITSVFPAVLEAVSECIKDKIIILVGK